MQTINAPHIHLDEHGIAWVDDTNTKVREIVLDVLAHGWTPNEIHLNHPHLSLAQIHAALSYYYDNKSLIDAEIERSLRKAEELRSAVGDSPLKKRLRVLGKIQ